MVIGEIERQEIIDLVRPIIDEGIERVLFAIPKIVGEVYQQVVAEKRLTKDFWTSHKEWLPDKDIVTSVLMEVEDANPGKSPEFVIQEATKLIPDRIRRVKSLDMTKPDRPKDFSYQGQSGEL